MQRIACHECDLVQTVPKIPLEGSARCPRCRAVLFRARRNSIDRTLAWTIAGLVLYGVSVSFPFLAMRSGSAVWHTTLLSGVQQMFRQGEAALAVVVFMTCVLIPLLQMLILLYIFLSLKMQRKAGLAIPLFRLFHHIRPWSMMEIYMLGILVAMVKLSKMAIIIPGLAVTAFGLLVIVLTCALSSIDSHLVWEQLGEET